jgi:hypothetical protein
MYSAPSRAIAFEFLQRTLITKRFFYIEIDTPEGRVGKDVDAIYDGSGDIKDGNPVAPPGFFAAVFTRGYLEPHVESTFTETLGHIPAIKETPDLIQNGYQIFHADVGEILEYLRREANTSKFEGFAIHRSSAPVSLLVSAFPRGTADVAAKLANKFPRGGHPYKQLLDVLLTQKRSAHLTHWIYIMIV